MVRLDRKGSVYVAVLGVALIVGVIGISSLHVARLEVRESTALVDMANARLAARSGIECAIAKLKSDSNWRTAYTSGVANLVSNLTGVLAADDAFEIAYVDSDGDLEDSNNDAVTVRSVGTAGRARHVLEVLLMPTGQGVSSLSASLHSDGKLEINSLFTTNQTVSSNEEVKIGSSGTVNGNVQAAGPISGTATGTKSPNMTPELEMPDPVDAFEYYVSNGTPINYGELSGGKIEKCVLSAGYNPFGAQIINAQGIYVINCQHNKVVVKDCRVRGTLVFLDASTVEVDGSILWEPHVAGLPAMLVQGSLNFRWDAQTSLSESTHNQNFNPPHTPYTTGSDSDRFDNYNGLISGLIYATGDLDMSSRNAFQGVVVIGGRVKCDATVNLIYDSSYYNDAPPGFSAGNDMEIVPGTWKQVAY